MTDTALESLVAGEVASSALSGSEVVEQLEANANKAMTVAWGSRRQNLDIRRSHSYDTGQGSFTILVR
ncbi:MULTISPECIES: hypothetical protein [unclassified Coleofasciculus]|uniref:hypothetical protein n=1 Tax=unclassified Coleofasciculus TaxID=2692782 RepID=UPI002AD30B37|nr:MULTISPECIES: hypothetical protein [unclassified Coleofasciculus]